MKILEVYLGVLQTVLFLVNFHAPIKTAKYAKQREYFPCTVYNAYLDKYLDSSNYKLYAVYGN